jgi:hypothetical protein
MLPVYDGKYLSRKAVYNWVANVSSMTKKLKRRCGSGWDNAQKTSMLRVSTHWQSDGTSVSILVEDMSRNEGFFPGWNITCFTFYIHLWPIYWLVVSNVRCMKIILLQRLSRRWEAQVWPRTCKLLTRTARLHGTIKLKLRSLGTDEEQSCTIWRYERIARFNCARCCYTCLCR